MTDGSPDPVFWADAVADEIEERDPEDPIVVKGGISPSGVPHLGNANEIVLGYFVAEVLRERNHTVRQLFTADDRDPLRKLPRTLADLDGTLVGLGDVDAGVLGRNLGRPYDAIPDPFGCCASYAAHFTDLIAAIAEDLAIPVDVVSTAQLYESGEMDAIVRALLDRREETAEVLSAFQETVAADYVPFRPHCANCGKEAGEVTGIDAAEGRVRYRCVDVEVGEHPVEGCGHEGEATVRAGKLPWRFEWVAQWSALGVDFEPFGKDHAEGSWPSGVAIARELLDVEPPVPFVYEWFTLDGEPFSSSAGHVVMVSEILELVEPPVLLSFFARDPTRGRDFSIARLDQLVDAFDRLEAVALGRIEADADERAYAERVYPFLVEEVRPERFRIPYRFAAVLGMSDDPAVRAEVARREGHVPSGAPEWAVKEALGRVERARRWAARTDNEYNYRLHRAEIPDHAIDDDVAAALDEVAGVVDAGGDGDAIQEAVFAAARARDLPPRTVFAAAYRLFLDRPDGPKLGPFLTTLDRSFVVDRLRLVA